VERDREPEGGRLDRDFAPGASNFSYMSWMSNNTYTVIGTSNAFTVTP
jgi:hypothetical protein